MQYRRAVASDHTTLAALRWDLKTDDGVETPSEPEETFAARYVAGLTGSDAVRFVADPGDGPVGVMTVVRAAKELSPSRGAGAIGYLTNVYLRPANRNLGHGTRLLQTVIDWACEDGLELLIVWPGDRSRPFYRRAGFSGSSDPLVLTIRSDED